MAALEEGRNLVETRGVETTRERQENLRHLQKEASQLANYYFVFQGVIFTAFYNAPSALKCRYHWIPFVLSLLAGVLNLCSLSTIAFKYKSVLDDVDRDAGARGQECRTGAELAVVKLASFSRLMYVLFCLALFIGFFVVTLIGSWVITCGDSQLAAAPPPPANN